MRARLRKKKLYCQQRNTFAFNQVLANVLTTQYNKEWREIESDVMRVFGSDRLAAWIWFITPAIALDGRRPADLVAAGGAHVVREHLIRLEFGVYT
jgi:uncharacterized protein (DUF2384 family)